MVFPIHLKRCRLALVVCLGLGPSPLWAAASDWQCQRSKDGKEWVCTSSKTKPADAGLPSADGAPSEAPEKETRTAEPTEPAASPHRTVRPTQPEAPPPVAAPELQPEEDIPARAAAREAPSKPQNAKAPVRAGTSAAPETPELSATPPEVEPIPETIAFPSPEEKPVATAKRRGWTCRPGETGESGRSWDCSLVGPDPKGQAHVVAEKDQEVKNWAESSSITWEDELRFQNLASLLPADPWANACAGKRESGPMTEFLLTPEDRLARKKAPLEIHSDHFEMVDDEVANFSGNAEMVQADQKLWGEFISHNTVTNTLNARGNVVYQEKGMTFASNTGFLDTDTDRGVFRNSQFILETVPARGTSRLTHLDSRTLSRYETFTYTSCPPGNQDWLLHASNVKINKDTGLGSARHAWLEFKGVPMLYTPYMSFPVDDRRLTGFLTPSFGITKVGGFDFTVPYYFNLAPNYDFTFTPRYLTKRGALLRGEFRYLTEMTHGRVMGEVLPHDDLRGDTRGQAGFLNDTRFTKNLTSHVDANYVSDDRYLNELGNPLNIVDQRFIRSHGILNYAGSNYSVRTLIDYYQTIDPTIPPFSTPYFRLPQLTFNYGEALFGTGLLFNGRAQLDVFQHSRGNVNDPNLANIANVEDRVTGQRLNLRPQLSYPIQAAAGFITPSFSLDHTEYWLQNTQFFQPAQGPAIPSNQSRTLPIFSVDSGLFFEREFDLLEKPLLQTLEPRLFYVFIPDKNQNDIPVFDSSENDFTFYQLFRENRFTGIDRIGDTNQITPALTSRLIDQSSSLERLRISVGEIFFFADRNVTLPSSVIQNNALVVQQPPPKTQDKSNIVADLYSALTDTWSFRVGGQWSPDRGQIDRGQVALQFNNHANELFNVAYRFRRDQNDPNLTRLDLTDVSARLPIATGWHVIGRWQYSLQDEVTLESFLGLERETCCWRFTLIGRHFINNIQPGTGQNQANNGIFVQLELKGLTRLGDQVDRFLERSVSGYRFFND